MRPTVGLRASARGKDMEIYEKVKKYLYGNIGHLTTAGTPRYDVKENAWKVPVLCKTERGIIVIGEFELDKDGNFLNIPTINKRCLRLLKWRWKDFHTFITGLKRNWTSIKSDR